jgi:transposase
MLAAQARDAGLSETTTVTFFQPQTPGQSIMKILALDLGKFNTMGCFFDTKTRTYSFHLASTDRNYLKTLFKKHPVDLVVLEACGPSGWIHDLAAHCGLKTLVCSTNEDAWKWANVKRKTDKDDALKLARMAAMNELKAVHMPSPQHREFRSLVKYRKTLDNRVNRMKNTIRALFVNHGFEIDRGEKAWNTGRALIVSFRKPLAQCTPEEYWRGELDLELTQLDAVTAQLELVTAKLDELGKLDPRIRRIQTIPGVGSGRVSGFGTGSRNPNASREGKTLSLEAHQQRHQCRYHCAASRSVAVRSARRLASPGQATDKRLRRRHLPGSPVML